MAGKSDKNTVDEQARAKEPEAHIIVDAKPLRGAALDDDEFVRARRAARRAAQEPVHPDVTSVTSSDDGISEVIDSAHTVWRGDYLRVESVEVTMPGGKRGHRDVVRHPGAVAIVALTDDGKIVVEHQYRTAMESVMVEIPAGKLDLGEEPAAAAARELLEETGYLADRMAYLGPFALAPGYSDEIIHMFMAMGLHFEGASPDEDEFIQVNLVDLDDMVDAVLDGRVTDAKTVIGVLLCDAISSRMAAE